MPWNKYRSSKEIQARRVSKKSGEQVSTLNGPQEAATGDYIVRERDSKDEGWNLRVVDSESFKRDFKSLSAK